MKRFFPDMLENPDKEAVIPGLVYWIAAYFVLPAILAFLVQYGRLPEHEIWLVGGYHILNFIVILCIYRSHLVDAFLNVQLDTRKILSVIFICAVIIVDLRSVLNELLWRTGDDLLYVTSNGTLPITEADILMSPDTMLWVQPIVSFICLGLLTPLTVSCLLYGCVFAPICVNRPWLAYIVTIAMAFLQKFILFFCLHDFNEQMAQFWIQLPVHLVACWSYQKTDTIWTPIGVHILANIFFCLYYFTFMI